MSAIMFGIVFRGAMFALKFEYSLFELKSKGMASFIKVKPVSPLPDK